MPRISKSWTEGASRTSTTPLWIAAPPKQNQAPPQPIAREELVVLVQRVFERRAVLERYVRLLALTGPRLRGAPARRVSREAVVQRLLDVGASPADATRAADAFVVDPTR